MNPVAAASGLEISTSSYSARPRLHSVVGHSAVSKDSPLATAVLARLDPAYERNHRQARVAVERGSDDYGLHAESEKTRGRRRLSWKLRASLARIIQSAF